MAHHSLRRAHGTWIGVVTPQDFEFLDLMQFRSIDGDAGGTWNPTAWIMIGGTYGIRIGATASFDCQGNGNILGNVVVGSNSSNTFRSYAAAVFESNLRTFGVLYPDGGINAAGSCDLCASASDNFLVRGTGHFYEAVTFDKATTFTGVATFNGNTVLGNAGTDTVTVNARMDIENSLVVETGASLTVAGPAYFNGSVALNNQGDDDAVIIQGGSFTVNCPITAGTNGYLVKRRWVTGTGQTVSLEDYDVVRVTESGTVFLQNFGDNGATIRIINASSGTLSIQVSGTGHVLRTLSAHTWIDMMRDSSWGANGWASAGEGTYTDIV